MDKQTYEQLDRIEENQQEIKEGILFGINLRTVDERLNLYEEEIQNEEGHLHHLKDDKIVKEYFEQLIKEENQEEEQEYSEEEEEPEYRTKPFN